jgi:hypothetical protein
MSPFKRLGLIFLLVSLPSYSAVSYRETYPDEMPAYIKKHYQEAVSKAYQRLFNDGAVLRCIESNTKHDYLDAQSVLEHSDNKLVDGSLFRNQIGIIRQHIKNGTDLAPIKIIQKFEDSFAYAWAHYGLAYTAEIPGRVFLHGGFEVAVNIAKIADGASTDVWGGVIAHEMLHNLMHAHPNPQEVGLEKAYATDILINAAQNCVTNANDPRDYSSRFRCGGRQ